MSQPPEPPVRALAPAAGRRPAWPILVAAGVLFLGPVILAVALYYGTSWRPDRHTNLGTLIQPPRPLLQVPLARAGGTRAERAPLTGKWSLVYIGDGRCNASCRQALYVMQQNFLGLGDAMPRVQRVFLANSHCCTDASGPLAQPGLIRFDASTPAAQRLLQQFPVRQRPTSLFLVDPLGNLMMQFDARTDSTAPEQDLRTLLNTSNIG